jgi:hemolysin-activating ACP:hemolysin acyltransferase
MANAKQPEQSIEHLGDDEAASNYRHDLVHELSRTLDAVWRYDQYIANAQGKPEAQKVWKKIKKQTKDNALQLESLLQADLASQ